MKRNLFWQVYKNLEKELLEITNIIYFNDDQLSVYSLKIAEMIMRAAMEIESIAKELYEQTGGEMNLPDVNGKKRDLYFDTDCLKHIESLWKLSKKEVFVVSPHFYFEKDENRVLTPLAKAYKMRKSGADWKRAYNAIKHYRSKSMQQASIKHLIRIMAALYLLNIYYKDDNIFIGRNKVASAIPSDSEIFAVASVVVDETNDDGSVNIAYADFEATTAAVYMMRTTEKSKLRENEIKNKVSAAINAHLIEKAKTGNYSSLEELLNDRSRNNVIEGVSGLEVEKVFSESEYEATLVKPDKISFQSSINRTDNPTGDNLKQIEERINEWTSAL